MTQETTHKELRILLLEDSPDDAELNERELRKAGLMFTSIRVDSREAFARALEYFRPDLILSDFNLPGFSGIAALGMVRHSCPEVPVIFVTGALSDAEAANLINAGAKDYVLKDRLARLAPAVQRAFSVEQGVKIRKLTEAQLHEKTELLENVINSSTDYIFVKDRELRTILCNEAFARALGKRPEELYGKTDIENGWDAELVKGNPEKNIRGFEQDDREALAGNVVHSSTDLGNVGGEIRYFDSVKVPLKSSDGHIFGMLGISRDVTERKQLELKDKALIRRNQVLMQGTSEGIHILNDRGDVIEANDAFCRHLGYTPAEILQLSIFDFEAKLTAVELRDNLEKLLDGHAVFESMHRRKDGVLVDVEVSVSGVELDGKKILFCLSHDITERKRIEEKLKLYAHDMKERVKEMSCLNDIITMALIKELSVEQLLDKCVRRMPDAWLEPLRTSARIRLGNQMFETPDFHETKWKLEAAIPQIGNKSGVVEVFYKGDENQDIKNPFLDEERALINSIAMQLGLSLERRRAEVELLKSEKALRHAQAIAQIGHFKFDPNTGLVKGSDELFRIFGLTREQLQFSDFLNSVHPDDRAIDVATIESAIKGKTGYTLEHRLLLHDGTLKWVRAIGEFVSDAPEGRPLLIGTVQDITERKRAEDARLESEGRYRSLLQSIDAAVVVHDKNTKITKINHSALKLLGITEDQAMGKTAFDPEWRFLNTDGTPMPPELFPVNQVISSGHALKEYIVGVNRPCCQDIVWVIVNAAPIFADNEIKEIIISFMDITERIKSEERLRLTAKVFENTIEGITITDSNGFILEVNDAFSRITGYTREEVIGKNSRILQSGLQDKAFYEAMWRSVMLTGHWRGDLYNRRKDGETYPETLTLSAITDNNGRVTNYVGIFSDITLLKQHEKQLEHIAHYDALTNIPNRVLLSDRLKQAIAFSKREKKLLAVCYLDLDGFKAINDSMGHEAGDMVLVEIAIRIKNAVREGDTVARLGGDEFVILLTGLEAPDECAASLNRLLEAAAKPIFINDKLFNLSASIGVSLYPLDDEDQDILLRHADQAMYTAKQSGRNRYYLYDREHDQRARTIHEYMKRIQQGLANNEFKLFLQPKINMRSGQPVGAEGLIRWQHPERGLLSPAEFLPAIEDTAIDIEVGEWVISTALNQLDEWQKAGLDMELSINISAFHMQSPEFSKKLKLKLLEYPGLSPSRLQIEILETAALKDIATAARIINSCRDFGVGFALDDFGTGYSSLAYLSNLPVDTLKIDQSFIRDMQDDKGDFAIVQGIVALSRVFNMSTVAEGVETTKCYKALLDMGCEIGQGYAISHPMPAENFLAWHKEKCNSVM